MEPRQHGSSHRESPEIRSIHKASMAGPGAAVSSLRRVEMYLEGGPPKISSLFCSTCSHRCSVFSPAWHRGDTTGRSVWSRNEIIRLAETGGEK
ncbi:hypothetical protein EYF80_030670 [Liparis tanakae]|uniref:Uncharacterized protein n=1 Tax=Liparis tanakae TaxID=230148 RepID=A0A4Z2H054_9TELE|nr:hypothetical protein EYF80_030670 [Liparis tanakae]